MPQPVSLISTTAHSPSGRVLDADLALALAAVADHVADGVRGIDDDVEHHLVELGRRAMHRGQVRVEIHLDLRHVFPLVAGDGNGALDRAIEIGRGLLARRMRELLHRAHDLGDAIDAFERLVERARNFFLEVVEVGFAEQLAGRFAADVDQLREQDVELAERFLEEAQVVADVLRRRIDFVRDTGGELADGLELLRLAQVVLEAVALLERLLEHGDVGDAAFPAGECLRWRRTAARC